MDQGERLGAEGHLPDWIGLGVLAAAVPRDAIEEAPAVHWRGVKRRGGKLPPHVMAYFAVGMALYAGAEIITELSDGPDQGGCRGSGWEVPGIGAITRARQRLGDGGAGRSVRRRRTAGRRAAHPPAPSRAAGG